MSHVKKTTYKSIVNNYRVDKKNEKTYPRQLP
jgi:hypothetical protein